MVIESRHPAHRLAACPSAPQVPLRSVEDIARKQVTEFVEIVAKNRPESIAKLIRLWLEETELS